MHDTREVERTEDVAEKRALLLESARKAGHRFIQVRGRDLEAVLSDDGPEDAAPAAVDLLPEPPAKPARKSRKKVKSDA